MKHEARNIPNETTLSHRNGTRVFHVMCFMFHIVHFQSSGLYTPPVFATSVNSCKREVVIASFGATAGGGVIGAADKLARSSASFMSLYQTLVLGRLEVWRMFKKNK